MKPKERRLEFGVDRLDWYQASGAPAWPTLDSIERSRNTVFKNSLHARGVAIGAASRRTTETQREGRFKSTLAPARAELRALRVGKLPGWTLHREGDRDG